MLSCLSFARQRKCYDPSWRSKLVLSAFVVLSCRNCFAMPGTPTLTVIGHLRSQKSQSKLVLAVVRPRTPNIQSKRWSVEELWNFFVLFVSLFKLHVYPQSVWYWAQGQHNLCVTEYMNTHAHTHMPHREPTTRTTCTKGFCQLGLCRWLKSNYGHPLGAPSGLIARCWHLWSNIIVKLLAYYVKCTCHALRAKIRDSSTLAPALWPLYVLDPDQNCSAQCLARNKGSARKNTQSTREFDKLPKQNQEALPFSM